MAKRKKLVHPADTPLREVTVEEAIPELGTRKDWVFVFVGIDRRNVEIDEDGDPVTVIYMTPGMTSSMAVALLGAADNKVSELAMEEARNDLRIPPREQLINPEADDDETETE